MVGSNSDAEAFLERGHRRGAFLERGQPRMAVKVRGWGRFTQKLRLLQNVALSPSLGMPNVLSEGMLRVEF